MLRARLRHQGGLGEALQVDHAVVGLGLQLGAKGSEGLPGLGRKRRAAPAALVTGNDLGHTLAAAHQVSEGGLHHPVNAGLGQGPADVLHGRHGMHDIAQG